MGTIPNVRSASLVKKSLIASALHFDIELAAGRAHRQDIRLWPPISPRQGVHFAQQTLRQHTDLEPQKGSDIKDHSPSVTARHAIKIERYIGLRFAIGQTRR